MKIPTRHGILASSPRARVPRGCGLARALTGGLAMALGLSLCGGAAAQKWVPVGPRPTTKGQVENIDRDEVVGAVKAIAPHPSDENIVYIGAVNGGVWASKNAE